MTKSKKIGLVLGIFLFVLIAAGLTYAWFTWRSEDLVISGNTKCFNINSTKGIDISNEEMLLLDEQEIISTPNITVVDGMSLTSFNAGIDTTCNMQGYINIAIDVDSIPDTENSYGAFKYALVRYDSEEYQDVSVDSLSGESFRMIAHGSIYEDGTKEILNDKLPDDGSLNNYIIIFYIDGNLAHDDIAYNEFDANIVVTASQVPEKTPIDDFFYILGTDQTEISTITYYNEDAGRNIEYTIESANNEENPVPLTIEEDEVLLLKYTGESNGINIPSTYTINNKVYNTVIIPYLYAYFYDEETYKGYDIELGTFNYNENINLVNIDKDTKSLDFDWDNEEYIESIYYLFDGMTSLTIILDFPNDITDMEGTFNYCTSLTTVPIIPDSVTNMNNAFTGCTSLTTVPIIPDSVTNMNSTFSGCTNLLEAPVIPESVTNMNNAFTGCSSLVTAPIIPDSVTNMEGTFNGCTNLLEAPVIPESVTNMTYTFLYCTSLIKAPVIPEGVTNMNSTFEGCTNLIEAPVIPESVTNMNGTFSGCNSLTTAPVIPEGVTNMKSTFSGCTNLTGTVHINSRNANTGNWDNNNPFYQTSKPITVEVPSGSATYNNINRYKPSNVTIAQY